MNYTIKTFMTGDGERFSQLYVADEPGFPLFYPTAFIARAILAYAHAVIYDSSRRWDVGDFVRTSYLHAFHDGFMFQTLNTVYILLGDGVRKRATLETVGRIF